MQYGSILNIFKVQCLRGQYRHAALKRKMVDRRTGLFVEEYGDRVTNS